MSKGGGSSKNQTQTTVSEPWRAAQPYLTDVMGRGQQLSYQQPQYYPGQTHVGPTAAENAAWAQRSGYNQSVFGGQPNLNYGDTVNATSSALQGNNALGNMSTSLAPGATGAVNSAFSPYDIGGRFDAIQGPQGSIRNPQAQAGNIGQYGFGTSLDAAGNSIVMSNKF